MKARAEWAVSVRPVSQKWVARRGWGNSCLTMQDVRVGGSFTATVGPARQVLSYEVGTRLGGGSHGVG